MTWNEADHPRDERGRFTAEGVDAWYDTVAEQISARAAAKGKRVKDPIMHAFQTGERPPGFEAAAARASHLESIPQGRRTADEQRELDALDEAFQEFRELVGFDGADRAIAPDGKPFAVDPKTANRYDWYGRARPTAAETNYRGGAQRSSFHRMNRTVRHKQHEVQSRRIEDWSGRGTKNGMAVDYRIVSNDMERPGRLGQRSAMESDAKGAAEFRAWLKRAKKRARAERAGADTWLMQVNGQMERRKGRG